MTAAQSGDDRAYEQLMREVSQWLSRYFRRRLSPAAAEDATQEALLAIHVHKQNYQTNAPMTPWLKTIARFKWIDQLRESFNSKLRDELLSIENFTSLREAEVLIESWRRRSNTIRPHSALRYTALAPETILAGTRTHAWPGTPASGGARPANPVVESKSTIHVVELLARRKGTPATKETILDHLYGECGEAEPKVVDGFVYKVRKKLTDAAGGPDYIEAAWGRG